MAQRLGIRDGRGRATGNSANMGGNEMDQVASLLIKARAVIEDESAWTKGALARSKYNRVIGPQAPGACRFCAFGALAHIIEGHGPGNPVWEKATDLLDAAAIQIAPDLATGDTNSMRPAAYLNDEGKHADVLRMYDLAIAPFGVDALKRAALARAPAAV